MILKRISNKEQVILLPYKRQLNPIKNLGQELSNFFTNYNIHSGSDLEARAETPSKIDFYPSNNSSSIWYEKISKSNLNSYNYFEENTICKVKEKKIINLNGINFVIHPKPYSNN